MRTFAALAVVVLLAGCSAERSGDAAPAAADEALADELASLFTAAADEGAPLDLDNLGDFEWDRLVFQCPYAERQPLEETLGFEWSDYRYIEEEGHNGFIFVRDRTVVASTILRRKSGDACGSDSNVKPQVSRSESIEVVRDGHEFLILRRAADAAGG